MTKKSRGMRLFGAKFNTLPRLRGNMQNFVMLFVLFSEFTTPRVWKTLGAFITTTIHAVREKRKEKEMNEIIVNRLEQLLKERMAGLVITHHDAGILAQYLADNGVIAAPVKIGDTVYIALDPKYNDGEGCVCTYKVCGIELNKDGKLCVLDGGNEPYEIDSLDCRLTRDAAEEDLRKMESGEIDNE